MKLPEAIEVLKDAMYIGSDEYASDYDRRMKEAIDTVVAEVEKPLPTDVQKEAWNAALEEVEALMRKPCWDLTLCEDIKKLKK